MAITRLAAALDGVKEDELVDAGLLIRPDEADRKPYDRFRGRLIIPIRDVRGRTIAFGGRILGQGEPKYLNSPETPLFDKGRTLFNIDRAGPAARKAGRAIVVEGYLDVIALDQAGIAEAVAPLGTALTEPQMARLWSLVDDPILCFDGDAAGRKASLRAATRALPVLRPGKTLRFALLPTGQDPDDLVRAGGARRSRRRSPRRCRSMSCSIRPSVTGTTWRGPRHAPGCASASTISPPPAPTGWCRKNIAAPLPASSSKISAGRKTSAAPSHRPRSVPPRPRRSAICASASCGRCSTACRACRT